MVPLSTRRPARRSFQRLVQSPGQADRSARVSLAVLVVSLIILLLHCRWYLPFLADDSLISLRYAQRLLDGHGLTWTDGPPVEGYSNLLWVLLAALLGRCGLDLIDAARLLGFGSAAMLLGAVVYGYRATTPRKSLPMVVGALSIVLAAPIAAWAIGGLESNLVAGLLGWAIVLCYPIVSGASLRSAASHPGRVVLASVFLALLCFTRPDGALWMAATVLALLLVNGLRAKTLRTVALLTLLPATFFLAQLAFRLSYYGEWLPNTALVKITGSATHAARGALYVLQGFLWLSPLSEAAVLVCLLLLLQRRDREVRSRAVLLAVCGVAWSGYVAMVGGDTFPAWRHLVPLVGLMGLVLAEGAQWFVHRGRGILAPALLIALLLPYCCLQFVDPHNRKARSELWEWDGQVIGLMLKQGFGPAQPLLAVSTAGCLPYWSELPAVDMLGLNDYYLPRHAPEDFGRGRPGHELGDGRYVLSRRPDLVVFAGPQGGREGYFPGERQLEQQPEFRRQYTLVRFEGREPYPCQSLIWVRRHSEKIGIRQSSDRITVPAYLLNADPATVAFLDQSGRFVVSIEPGRPAAIKSVELPPGTWRVEVAATAPVHVTVRPSGELAATTTLAAGLAPMTLILHGDNSRPLDVSINLPPAARQERIEVRELVFVREKGNQPAGAAGVCDSGR